MPTPLKKEDKRHAKDHKNTQIKNMWGGGVMTNLMPFVKIQYYYFFNVITIKILKLK